jgi:hypothetical protein
MKPLELRRELILRLVRGELEGFPPIKQAKIGLMFGLTRQRINNILKQTGVKPLAHSEYMSKLWEHIRAKEQTNNQTTEQTTEQTNN